MSKNSFLLALILALVLACLLGLQSSWQQSKNTQQKTAEEKSSPSQTTLALKPNPLYVTSKDSLTTQSAVNVHINTKKNKVTAVQLELSYDPTLLSDVNIVPGPFFTERTELLKEIKNGTILYSLGVTPGMPGKKGKGIIATVTFRMDTGDSTITPIAFLPKTMVTAEGESFSVLKSAKESLIYINKGTGEE